MGGCIIFKIVLILHGFSYDKVMNKIFQFCFYLFLMLYPSVLTANDYPKRELRGVWVATVWGIDWPSKTGTSPSVVSQQKEELRALLDRCRKLNLTTVYFQVRSMGDVMYESAIEPWSGFVSGRRGVSPGWDPLEFMVKECHARGLECYAWVNPFRWSSGTDYDTAHDRKWKKQGWLLKWGKYTVFNPGLEEVRNHIVEVCREIVTGYDIDGLVFDDYFYPNRIPENKDAADHNLYIREAPWMSFGDWRRANIHKTVADVSAMIRDTRPDVRFGISPAGVAGKHDTSAAKWGAEHCGVKAADWQFREIYSDPLGWLYQGTVDFISPQLYWATGHATAPFGPLAKWWSNTANLYGTHFYSSVTLERIDQGSRSENIRDLGRQILTNREVSIDGNMGFVIYSAKFLPAVERMLAEGPFAYPSITPQLFPARETPPAPDGLKLKGGILSWKPVALGERGIVRYTVYEVPRNVSLSDAMAENGDGLSGDFLLGVTYDTEFMLPANGRNRYAVCTLDGYSTESAPVWIE